MDRRQAYIERTRANADNDIGPWLSITILKDSAKRARNNNWDFDIDRSYLVDLWNQQDGRCAISRVKMQTESGTLQQKNPRRASLDRIDNSKGYVKGNVRFTCHWVNNAKSTWGDDVFESFINSIIESRK